MLFIWTPSPYHPQSIRKRFLFFYHGHVCRYYVKRPLKRHFSRFLEKSLVLRQYCHNRIQLPKFLTPDMERPMLALITAERKIFWDPWQVDILGSKNRVKMSILQVPKTYCNAWCKNSTRVIFKAIIFFLKEGQGWYFVVIYKVFWNNFAFWWGGVVNMS